jgi:exodeoxyribonuclease-5
MPYDGDKPMIQFTPAQTAALDALLAFANGAHGAQMMTLEGYAGTGKTTLVGELVRRLGHDLNIAIAAPTNKAVGVLQEKVGPQGEAEFRSIHSFLGLKMRDNEDGSRQCLQDGTPSLHQYHLAIIDECSMISDPLFGMIVSAARSCRVLFVGDPAQLPPVDQAAVRQHLSSTFERVQHKAVLTEVVRQAADNPIIAMSMKIREAIEQGRAMAPEALLEAMPNGQCDQTTLASGGEATAYNFTLGAIQNGLDARIVAYRNTVVDRYNGMIHAALYGTQTPFAVGERVIINEHFDDARLTNTEWRKAKRVALYTSEEAVVSSIEPEAHPFYPDVPAYRVVLARDGGDPDVAVFIPSDLAAFNRHKESLWADWRRLKSEEEVARMNGRSASSLSEKRKDAAKAAGMFSRAFAPLRHVYAITAHKSQGSTIDTIVVDYSDLARMKEPFDFNRALYVAVTRAARHVAIVI